MNEKKLIALAEICVQHQTEISFIESLQVAGLIEVLNIEDAYFIERDQLPILEKYINFHYSLEINLEGIETISHLLSRINVLQEEARTLKNRLQFYESDNSTRQTII